MNVNLKATCIRYKTYPFVGLVVPYEPGALSDLQV